MRIPEFRFTIEDYHTDDEVLGMVKTILKLNRDENLMDIMSNTRKGYQVEVKRFNLFMASRECDC